MKSVKNIATTLVLIALSCIVVPGFVYPQEEAGQLFEKGLYLEESQGDLEGAISLYEKAVKDSKAERDIAAKAQLHIGMCYEKLGLREARLAYQKVVDNYPQQQQEVASARQRLAALSKTSDADKEPVFTSRQVWAETFISASMSSPSPDGRFLTSAGQDVSVHDLETGVTRRLTNEGSLGQGDAYPARWSPDGKYIAYGWDNGSYMDVRVISAEGGESRILVDNKEEEGGMEVFDWSPDSKKILALLEKKDGTRQILLVSAADGATTVLKTFEGPGDWPLMRFSRDGQYIAYDWPQEKGVPERDIFVISTDGKREFPLLQHPADDRLLGWPPNGKSILFASDRTGSLDMWLQTVSGGKVQGSPVLVKRGVDQIAPLGFTQNGDFYYTLFPNMFDVYGARMDFRSGKVLAPPEAIIKRNEGRNSWPDYSADGKYLAYLTTRSRSFGNEASLVYPSLNILCIRSLEGGKEREFSSRFKQLAGTQWSPDGQSVYLTAWDDEGAGIYRVDAQTGEFTPIVRNLPSINYPFSSHRVTPDNKTIIYLRMKGMLEPFQVIAKNLITGEEKQLYSGPDSGNSLSISPDGQWLALLSGYGIKVLQVIHLSGGEPKELLKFPGNLSLVMPSSIGWTADGKYILFQRLHDGMQVDLWRIAVDGGELQKLNLLTGAFRGLSAHPDGQHFVFGARSFPQEIPANWVMENFLPPELSASRPIASASPPAASAFKERPNPFVGTWVLNLDKSSKNVRTKSIIMDVEAQDNGLKFTTEWVNSEGISFHMEMAPRFDGKDYPVFGIPEAVFGIPEARTRSLRRINTNSFEQVSKKDGKQRTRNLVVISEDGMTWTCTVKEIDSGVTITRVFDKQED